MSPTVLARRKWWVTAVVVVLLATIVWVVTQTVGGSSSGPEDAPEPGAAGASETASPPPGSEPSSGPTATPSPGSLDVVPTGQKRTEPPVPLGAIGDFGTGITLEITGVDAVDGVARGPGEIAGPAVRLALELTNHTDRPVSLESVVLEATYGPDRTPALTLTGPGGEPFGGDLEPGDVERGRYVFAVPVAARDRVQVTASYTAEAPAVVFTGSVR